MNTVRPPKLAQQLLRYFCAEEWLDEVLGDLQEQYIDKVESKGKFRASISYWWHSIRLLRPHIIKRKHRSTRVMMTRNHLKISYRNLSKNKIYSAINILGLAVGIASIMLIGIYVNYETSYDKFFDDSDQISRIALNRVYPGRVKTFGTSSIMLAPHPKGKLSTSRRSY